jgi:hypothetical protein
MGMSGRSLAAVVVGQGLISGVTGSIPGCLVGALVVTAIRGHGLEAEARAAAAALTLRRMQALRSDAIVSASERTLTATLDEARVMLDYATIKAPFWGTLMRKFKEVGEGVVTGSLPDPIFRIADLSRLKVIAEVPETDIGAVAAGQPAEVTRAFRAFTASCSHSVSESHRPPAADRPPERHGESHHRVDRPGTCAGSSGRTSHTTTALGATSPWDGTRLTAARSRVRSGARSSPSRRSGVSIIATNAGRHDRGWVSGRDGIRVALWEPNIILLS